MTAVLENIERILKSKKKDKHARYVALDIVKQELRKLREPATNVVLPKLNTATFNAILDHMKHGKYTEAIKVLRAYSGLGLKEAKDIVEKHPAFSKYFPKNLSSPYAL